MTPTNSAIGEWPSTIGNARLAIDDRSSAIEDAQLAIGDRPSAIGNARLAFGDRLSAIGDERPAIARLSDEELILDVKRLANCERRATADLVAALAELDVRRLYLGQGCASLFTYCTQVLHFSEQAAYLRIQAARLARHFPLALARLASGDLTLTTLVLLGPQLTEANHRALFDEARHQGRRAVELIVARLRPQPDVPASIRKVPERTGGDDGTLAAMACQGGAAPRAMGIGRGGDQASRQSVSALDLLAGQMTPVAAAPAAGGDVVATRGLAALAAPAGRCGVAMPCRPASIRPLAPTRYHLHVTISAETHAKLRRAQDLLRHVITDGDPAVILDRALTLLVDRLERDRTKKTTRPRVAGEAAKSGGAGGQPEPGEVSAAPAASEEGVRCHASKTGGASDVRRAGWPAAPPATARRPRVPAATVRAVWQRDEARCTFVGAEGRCRETTFLEVHHLRPVARGGPSTVGNLVLRCRAHNQGEAIRDFGAEAVAAGRAAARRRREAAESGTLFGQS
jgi:hypothetical protein